MASADTDADAAVVEAVSSVLHIEVAWSPAARQVELLSLEIAPGSTVRQALQASGLAQRVEGDVTLAVWGRPVLASTELRDGDRVELCRPLQVDPKEARRVRYRAQGERGRRRVSGSRSR